MRRALVWVLGLVALLALALGLVAVLRAVGIPAPIAVVVAVLAARWLERFLPDYVSPVRAFGTREIARTRPVRRRAASARVAACACRCGSCAGDAQCDRPAPIGACGASGC